MRRSNLYILLPDTASSIARVMSPEELQHRAQLSRWVKKLFPDIVSSKSPLFALPLEVRDRIYHYALMGVGVRFHHLNTTVCAMYGVRIGIASNYSISPDRWWRFSGMHAGLPAWMQLDKQILFECILQFHREAVFFHTNDFFHPLLARTRPLGLFRLDRAWNVHLTGRKALLLSSWPERGNQGHVNRVLGQNQAQEAVTKQTVYHIASSPMLQILSLNVQFSWLNYEGTNPSVQDIRCDLSYVEQLPKSLQKVTFHLDDLIIRRYYNHDTRILQAKESIKGELRRIGKTFVSDPGGLSVESMVCSVHGLEAEPCSTSSGYEFLWSFTVTSAAYRRAQNSKSQ